MLKKNQEALYELTLYHFGNYIARSFDLFIHCFT
jgi:hypothetical protein